MWTCASLSPIFFFLHTEKGRKLGPPKKKINKIKKNKQEQNCRPFLHTVCKPNKRLFIYFSFFFVWEDRQIVS